MAILSSIGFFKTIPWGDHLVAVVGINWRELAQDKFVWKKNIIRWTLRLLEKLHQPFRATLLPKLPQPYIKDCMRMMVPDCSGFWCCLVNGNFIDVKGGMNLKKPKLLKIAKSLATVSPHDSFTFRA